MMRGRRRNDTHDDDDDDAIWIYGLKGRRGLA